MKPKKFEAYAIFSDADGECDCNEVTAHPVEFRIVEGYTERKVMVVDLDEFQSIEAEANTDADLIKRLNASLAEARAERDRLRVALNGLMPWVSTGEVGHCNGDKCRELWCADCFGEEQAEGSIEKARQAMITARKAPEGEASEHE